MVKFWGRILGEARIEGVQCLRFEREARPEDTKRLRLRVKPILRVNPKSQPKIEGEA